MKRSLLVLIGLSFPAVAEPRTDAYGDPLPEGALARFGTVRYRIGHIDVWALSPDGKTLAVEDDKDLSLWDVETGRVLRVATPDDPPSFCLCFSPDNKQLARLVNGQLYVLDAGTGSERYRRDMPSDGRAVAFVPGTNEVAVLSNDGGRVCIVDAADARRFTIRELNACVRIMSPTGRCFLGQSDVGWYGVDTKTTRVRCRFPDTQELDDPVLSADDRRVCFATPAGRLLVFDPRTGKKLADAVAPAGWGEEDGPTVRAVVSPDATFAYLSRSKRPTLRRDLKAEKWLEPLPAMPGGPLIPHPDGKRVLLLGDDGVLRRYDLAKLKETPPPHGFATGLVAVPSPDGRRVAVTTGELDSQLDLLDLTGRVVWSVALRGRQGAPHWSADGRHVACAGGREATVCDAVTGKVVHVLRSPDAGRQFTGLVAFVPGDRLVAALDNGEAVATFDLKAGGRGQLMRPDLKWVTDVSPDGRTLAFERGGPDVALFDAANGRLRVGWTFPPPERRGCGGDGFHSDSYWARFSPDGSYLLTWYDGLVILRHPVSGEPERVIKTGFESIDHVAFSPDGLWLAIATGEKVSLWDVPTGTSLVGWETDHRVFINHLAFAGPGRLVTSSDDLTALLWDLKPRKRLTRPVWEALAGDDAADAYRAVWALATDPSGPDQLRAKITPAKPVPAGQVRRWIADLGADRYVVREEAASVLQEFGRLIEPELRTARAKATSEEVRTRLDGLLAQIPPHRDEMEVVQARAIAAMELAGTDAAKKLLAEWAGGAPGARLTVDAKAALGRLGR